MIKLWFLLNIQPFKQFLLFWKQNDFNVSCDHVQWFMNPYYEQKANRTPMYDITTQVEINL